MLAGEMVSRLMNVGRYMVDGSWLLVRRTCLGLEEVLQVCRPRKPGGKGEENR